MGSNVRRKQNSFVTGLKTEWSLFWDTLIGDDESDEVPAPEAQENSKDPFLTGKLETLSLEKIKVITKALSQDRKTLNQKLESLKKELDQNSTKLESPLLVDEKEQTHKRIHELSDLGQSLSEKLTMINERLKQARSVEDRIKAELKAETKKP